MKIIYDNDASSDDVTALIYLASHPDVTLEAVTIAGTGEAHGPDGARNIADLCYMLGKPNIPIAYGNEKPCDASGKPFPDVLRNLMDNLFKDKDVPKHPNPPINDSAVELIKTVLESSSEKVTILATGPLTNIAQFIEQYPYLKDNIEKIVIMGGAVNVHGNIKALDPTSDNIVAEWNIYADPKAADIVFSSKIPVTLVPLDATNQVPMTKAFYDSLSHQLHAGLKLIYQLLKVIVDNYGMELFLKEFYLWDPLAAMICVDPQLAITKTMAIAMDLKNAQTKPVAENSHGASLIQVAVEIPQAHLILGQLISEIKSNLIHAQSKTTPTNLFQIPPEVKMDSFQQAHSFEKRLS
ncbi:nucleoside hydrolase [Aquicella lusitana]|uniref:Pyrimidine-specific ribonucleoside hydrolase n=1 Tax=Aquicella lusitana TaxID=254246 RepID=A0A370GYV7_9COXI|nr:nucleoside hydrolase [Aquicella lusitana]RDI48689.1 pyrimidine-specific ribonucleoside hydrolase [Aquicella lusitana]VVC73934.1 Pyrimidine-specific ribonucleoside hydrolase RihA [Aquicella lusitana]